MPVRPNQKLPDTVLVGTYRREQLGKWILPKGFYNYPIADENEIPAKLQNVIKELWLFNGKRKQLIFDAECLGILERSQLEDYPKSPSKPHSQKYLLFKIAQKFASSLEDAPVIVRSADFSRSPTVRKQIKVALQSSDRRVRTTVAKHLPPIVVRLPVERLCVCEEALQLDFSSLFRRAEILRQTTAALAILARARNHHQLTCVEICAGAGGQAIGLEMAGFEHVALVEYEPWKHAA